MSKQRLSWIDIAKCIGIFAIVLGHCSAGKLQWICFSFNSVIFFVLAGMTFCRKTGETDAYFDFDHERTFKSFLHRTFRTIGIPYLLWGGEHTDLFRYGKNNGKDPEFGRIPF